MPAINEQQAKEFLNEITSEDSVAIIHHDDGDGFCSAILFHDHCVEKGATVKAFTYNLSKTNLENLPLEPFNKIIMTDISSKATQEQIKSLSDKEILYSDHHPKFPLPEKVLALLTVDQGYIPSSRTAYELTSQKKWLGLIGTIADSGNLYKENDEFIKDALEELNLTLEEFKTKYSHIFSDTIIYFSENPDSLFPRLAKIKSIEEIEQLREYAKVVEKEIEKYVEEYETKAEKIGNVNIYKFKPKYPIKGVVAAVVGRKYSGEIFLFLSEKSSNKEFIGISARHDSEDANLPKLLEAATKNLENANSGGHLRASGGQIQTKDLEKFKQNIKDYFSK